MSKVHLFLGLTLLLWGTAAIAGQDNCQVAPCDPNQIDLNPCDPCGTLETPFTFGGWVEAGVYVNGNGSGDNGPMHIPSNQRTDFLMNQLYLYGEKTMDASRGFDWGGRVDLVYGVDGPGMQNLDGTFDSEWGNNRHGYGMAAYQVYGTLGYKDLSVKIGKFITPVGWEGAASKDNFFYSHSHCYWIEPATHTGVLASYNMTDRLTVNGGWTAGENNGFDNPDNHSAVLAGFTYQLADNASIIYWFNGGRAPIDEDDINYYVQSLCFQWDMTDRFTYVFQWNLRNQETEGVVSTYDYGINNHFLYKLNDRWSAGVRFDWLRDGGWAAFNDDLSDYYGVTLGLNWAPFENVSIRPEVRYDWCRGGAIPYAGGTKREQVTGGVGFVVSF
jgi:hypothetical protein